MIAQNRGGLSFIMLLMESWVSGLNQDKEIWMHFSQMHSLVSEAIQIHKYAHETLSQLQEEIAKWEEEARLKLAQMQKIETQEPPKR